MSCGTEKSRGHSDPVQLPHPSNVHLGRFQNDVDVSTNGQNLPRNPRTPPQDGAGGMEDVPDLSQYFPALYRTPTSSSSTDGFPPPRIVKFSTLIPDLERMRSERDVMAAWVIYQKLREPLSNANRSGGDTALLYTSLHRLIRLLSATTPRSEAMCSKIISVLSTLHQVGGEFRKWQLRLLRAIAKKQNLHPQEFEHLKDLMVDILPPSVNPRASNPNVAPPTFKCGNTHPLIFDVPPEDLPVIDFSKEFQSPILVAPIPTTFPQDHERARLLNVIGETQSFNEAWDAYLAFSTHPLAEDPTLNTYPSRHLHRLVSLLATIKPRTRKVYLSLASIMSTIRASGHLIYPWEWNLLMDTSAKGWRKTRFEDYKASLRVFNDMLAYQREARESNNPPHASQNRRTNSQEEESILAHDNLAPDIYSYSTLISHAARTLSPRALEHARSLLSSAGINPNCVTLLAQLRLHTYHNQMYGVRRTVAEIRDKGLNLDISGVNSIIWAFAKNEHMEVAEAIYRVLRSNIDTSRPGDGVFGGVDEDIAATVRFLEEMENIVIQPDMVPDRVTYTILIQSYAYRGDLARSLQVFADMLSSPDPFATWRGEVGAEARFPPVMQIFRGLFLGFYRYGVGPGDHPRGNRRRRGSRKSGLKWNLDNLYAIYKGFLELPADQQPEDKVVYWLMMAFERCTGGNYRKMEKVWWALERKWGTQWGSRLREIRRRIHQNVPKRPRSRVFRVGRRARTVANGGQLHPQD